MFCKHWTKIDANLVNSFYHDDDDEVDDNDDEELGR